MIQMGLQKLNSVFFLTIFFKFMIDFWDLVVMLPSEIDHGACGVGFLGHRDIYRFNVLDRRTFKLKLVD